MENEIEVVRQELPSILSWAQNLVVTNKEEYADTLMKAKGIKSKISFWKNYWKPVKEKAKGVHTDICAKENSGLNILQPAYDLSKKKADDWSANEERKAAAEQARLQAIENEKSRREKEAAIKAAEKLKSPELKAARLEEAEQIRPPEITIEPPTPKIEGVSHRVTVKARLVDMAALIAAATPGSIASTFLIFDQSGANKATSTKNKVPVPGIEYYEERTSAVRRE